jgi:hypothetical protein
MFKVLSGGEEDYLSANIVAKFPDIERIARDAVEILRYSQFSNQNQKDAAAYTAKALEEAIRAAREDIPIR